MTRLVTVDPDRPDPARLEAPAAALRAGRLVAFPTETVYGLGAHARDAQAVGALFAAKGRPATNPLIVHVPDGAALGGLVASVTPLAAALADRWWPGPLTLVLDAAPSVPAVTTGGLSTVAVRAPDHPVAEALLRQAGVPVAAPSANTSGRPSPTRAEHVHADLAAAVDWIVDGGACRVGVESTVVDARGEVPLVLREGAVTREDLGVTGQAAADAQAQRHSPGARFRHYAPACRVEIAPPGEGPARAGGLAAAGHRVGLVARAVPPAGVTEVGTFGDARDLAVGLYDALRRAERAELEVLVVEGVPEEGVGRAVMDRLRRAAQA